MIHSFTTDQHCTRNKKAFWLLWGFGQSNSPKAKLFDFVLILFSFTHTVEYQ